MKIKEIKKLSVDELKKKVNLLKKDLFNLRFRKVNGQIENSANFSTTKKDLAKIEWSKIYAREFINLNSLSDYNPDFLILRSSFLSLNCFSKVL